MKVINFNSPYLILYMFSCTTGVEKGSIEHIDKVTLEINDQRILNSKYNIADLITHRLNCQEVRNCLLTQINQENVDQLGLIWSFNLGAKKGIESTALVVRNHVFDRLCSIVYAVKTRIGSMT